MKKTHSLEGQGCKKTLWLILLLGIFLVGNASSADWDNVKSYNPNTKTITVTNWLGIGDTIGEAKLLTPLNVIVPRGYQKVAEFEIKSYKDYENALNKVEFYNFHNKETISRTYDFKYKTVETIKVIDYETVCDKAKFEKNQSEYEKCYEKEKGSHEEERIVWEDITKDLLKDQTLTIGIFTDVQVGDYVEWIPTIFGVDVSEWATWSESLNVGLVLYYNCNSSDELISHVANLSNHVGLISYNSTNALNGNACQFTVGNNVMINSSVTNYTNLKNGLSTMNMWFRPMNALGNDPMPFVQSADNNPYFQIYLDKYYLDGVTSVLYETAPIVDGIYQMLTLVNNGTGMIVYINGTQVQYAGVGASWENATWNLGSVSSGASFNFAGQMDELSWWTRAINSTEVIQLYNGGAGMTYIPTAITNLPPIVIPYTPINYSNYTTSPTTIDFICYGNDDVNFTKMELYLNASVVYTNTSGINNTNYTYSPSLNDGNYVWSCKGYDNSLTTESSNRSFTIDGTSPIFIIGSPINISYTSNMSVFNYTMIETNPNSCWYSLDNGVTNTSVVCSENATGLTSVEGVNTWFIYGNDTLGNNGSNSVTFTKDTITPVFSIIFPINTTYFYNATTLGYNYTDSNPGSCWYSLDGGITNSSSISAGTNFTNVPIQYGLNSLRLYCNDSFGNKDNTAISFTISQFLIIGENYDASILEGSSSTFIFNYTIGDYYNVNFAQLVYDGVYYSGTTSTIAGKNMSSTYTLITPPVSTDTNKTFNWIVTLNDSSTHNSTSHNQLVLNFNLDNCSANSILILNFTMKDEDSEAYLVDTTDNTSIKVDLSLSTYTSNPIELVTFSKFYDKTLPARICMNSSLGTTQYYLDSLIEYNSLERADEFYNIQRYNLNSTSNTYQNISLYDLNTSSNQPFRISYKDSSYLPIESALIEIQRKYVDQGVFKVVEIPKTDPYGETIGNLVLNNVIYNFIVKKNGVTLGSFSNVRVVCQTPLVSECVLNLNSFSSSISLTNYFSEGDFVYTLLHNRTSRTTSAVFDIPSGTIVTVKLNVSDGLGNNVCSQSTTSSSGTLSCTYLLTVKNQTMMANLYKNGVLIGTGQVDIGKTSLQTYGGITALLGIFIMITLIGVALTDSPIIMVVSLLIGVILLYAMNVVSHTAFIGYGATILFLVIAIVLILIKAGKRQ